MPWQYTYIGNHVLLFRYTMVYYPLRARGRLHFISTPGKLSKPVLQCSSCSSWQQGGKGRSLRIFAYHASLLAHFIGLVKLRGPSMQQLWRNSSQHISAGLSWEDHLRSDLQIFKHFFSTSLRKSPILFSGWLGDHFYYLHDDIVTTDPSHMLPQQFQN